jgi:hypothetical protein
MFFVTRNADGTIKTVSRQAQPGSEALEDGDEEIAQFFNQANDSYFHAVDADFVRVLEDLIDTLIMKNIIRHTDLPSAAQRKLVLRKGLRNRIQGALNLLDNDPRIL